MRSDVFSLWISLRKSSTMLTTLFHLSVLLSLCRGFESDDKLVTAILNTLDVRHCDLGYAYDSARPREIIATTNDRLEMKKIVIYHSSAVIHPGPSLSKHLGEKKCLPQYYAVKTDVWFISLILSTSI